MLRPPIAIRTLWAETRTATRPRRRRMQPPASSGGRLRKWVMTEYEPVKSEEVYVEGQGQVGEPPTR